MPLSYDVDILADTGNYFVLLRCMRYMDGWSDRRTETELDAR